MRRPERSATRWLRLDAGYCAVGGGLTVVLADRLARLVDVPALVVVGLGLAAMAWAVVLEVLSRSRRLRSALATVAAANASAAVACAVLAATATEAAAGLLLAGLAVEVGAFAAVQARLVRRWRQSVQPSAPQ